MGVLYQMEWLFRLQQVLVLCFVVVASYLHVISCDPNVVLADGKSLGHCIKH